jgi:hypothetical protein
MPDHPLPRAVLAGDLDAVVASFTPDAVLRSPITDRFVFEGRDQLRALYRAIIAITEDLEYTHEVHDGDTMVLAFRCRIGGQPMQSVDLLRLDDDGRVREFTAFFRPLVGVTTLLANIGPELVEPHAPRRARLIALLTGPLVALNRFADWMGVRLVGGYVAKASITDRTASMPPKAGGHSSVRS